MEAATSSSCQNAPVSEQEASVSGAEVEATKRIDYPNTAALSFAKCHKVTQEKPQW
jgi:hypothetical protein